RDGRAAHLKDAPATLPRKGERGDGAGRELVGAEAEDLAGSFRGGADGGDPKAAQPVEQGADEPLDRGHVPRGENWVEGVEDERPHAAAADDLFELRQGRPEVAEGGDFGLEARTEREDRELP